MGCLSSKSSVAPEPPASEAARATEATKRQQEHQKFKSEFTDISKCFDTFEQKGLDYKVTGTCDMALIEFIAASKVRITENPPTLNNLTKEIDIVSSWKESIIFRQCSQNERNELEEHCVFINEEILKLE